jgi:hypothetical protein
LPQKAGHSSMVWLLIIFCLAVAVSPLLWMKSSPRQQHITDCRRKARGLSIHVNLRRRPGALETEHRIDTVYYWLPWLKAKKVQGWILHRSSRRGWESSFDNWRWINNEANKEWHDIITTILSELPEGINAIQVSSEGVGLVWDERGTIDLIDKIHASLLKLRQKGEEIFS